MLLCDAQKLARTLMAENMPGLAEGGWRFAFDNAKTRCGSCKFRPRLITISRHYAARNDVDQVRNTILHEIAHAIAGPGVGHGVAWKQIARYLGTSTERCNSQAVMPPAKYMAHCTQCHTTYRRHRVSRRLRASVWCSCGNPDPLRWKVSRASLTA